MIVVAASIAARVSVSIRRIASSPIRNSQSAIRNRIRAPEVDAMLLAIVFAAAMGGGPVEQQAVIEEPARVATVDETAPVAVPEPSDKAMRYYGSGNVLWAIDNHPPLGERIDFTNQYHPWREGRLVYGDRFKR
jgi:hypothetical protein